LIARWLTQRCRDEDVPRASRVRPGLARFLEEQYSRSPLTDPWAGRQRADTWTWHHGDGRGVVWRDRDRDVLWLLCFADEHDGGYELGHTLVSAHPGEDRLYPKLDPTHAAAGGPTAAWEEFLDEDIIEWIRFIHGAAEFFDDRQSDLDGGELVEWRAAGVIGLAQDEDFLRMTIGTRLVYPDNAIDRDRYLRPGEVEDLFLQLVGDLEDDLWEAHVPPYGHGYVGYLFVPPRPDAAAWLDARIAEIIAAKPRRGSNPSRI
jgi:hypothetical protein